MSAISGNARGKEFSILAGVLAMLAAVASALILSLVLSSASASPAYADEVDPQTQAALAELQEEFIEAYDEANGEGSASELMKSLSAASNTQTITDDETPLAAHPAAEEQILDEENPLAASPYAAPVHDFVWVLLVVIAGVAAYFFVSTRRLDKNINQMRRFVD